MSFNAHSRERLETLGRQLPKKLPTPVNQSDASSTSIKKVSAHRHKVETEQDPKQLFKDLMDISADGTVPPHLMERLRDLESSTQSPSEPSNAKPSSSSTGKRRSLSNPAIKTDNDHYTEFRQLLLEDEDLA